MKIISNHRQSDDKYKHGLLLTQDELMLVLQLIGNVSSLHLRKIKHKDSMDYAEMLKHVGGRQGLYSKFTLGAVNFDGNLPVIKIKPVSTE